MNATPTIHVVDDDESLRTALLRVLDAAGFQVRGYGSTGDFLLNAPPDQPGCLVLDVRLPGPSGLELQDALHRRGVNLPVIFLTAYPEVPTSVRAMKAGAVDFLAKPVERETLIDAVQRALLRGDAAREARADGDRLRALFSTLTDQERAVFDLIVAGKLNKQVGDALGLAERTVKAKRAHLMEKLGVGSAAELGRLAEQLKQASRDR